MGKILLYWLSVKSDRKLSRSVLKAGDSLGTSVYRLEETETEKERLERLLYRNEIIIPAT